MLARPPTVLAPSSFRSAPKNASSVRARSGYSHQSRRCLRHRLDASAYDRAYAELGLHFWRLGESQLSVAGCVAQSSDAAVLTRWPAVSLLRKASERGPSTVHQIRPPSRLARAFIIAILLLLTNQIVNNTAQHTGCTTDVQHAVERGSS
jgi:hypothetical protein